MNKKSKFALILAMVLLIVSIFTENNSIIALSTVGCFLFLLVSRISDQVYREKLIKDIKNNSLEFVIVKENSKWMILLVLVMILNFTNAIKTRFEMYRINNANSSNDVKIFLTNLDFSEQLLMLCILIFIILCVLVIYQVLFNKTIVSNTNIIFYDGTVFNIASIDDIDYDKWSISKNKKVIKIGNGLLDRNIIVSLEEYDKVKSMIESKNNN